MLYRWILFTFFSKPSAMKVPPLHCSDSCRNTADLDIRDSTARTAFMFLKKKMRD